MTKGLVRRASNRLLHWLARSLPGAAGLRPRLHRLRGVTIGPDVFIGDDVYLENEFPEAVHIERGVQISVRAIIIAHTRGVGRIIIEKNAYIGANAVISASAGRTLRIGEGAVVGAGAVVSTDVAPHTFVANEPPRAVARVLVPLATAERMEDFIRGLVPIRPRRGSERAVARPSADPGEPLP